MKVYTQAIDVKTETYTGATTTQTGAAWASTQEHDSLLFESDITVNSGTGSVTPSVLFSPTFDGTYTTLFEGDAITATTTQRSHILDISFVLTGFYKIVQTVSGTINFTGTGKLYQARRAAS